MEEIKKTLHTLKFWFGAFWIVPLIMVVIGELSDGSTGPWAHNVSMVYGMETITILLTCASVPVALKLFAWVLQKKIDKVDLLEALRLYERWSLIRLLLLFIPVVMGLLTYYTCMSTTGLLCAAIGLTASLFCVPTEKRLRTDLYIEA